MITTTRNPASSTSAQSGDQPSIFPVRFDWPLAYEAEKFCRDHIDRFLEHNAFAAQLAARKRDETGTDIFEWVDHLYLPQIDEGELTRAGFILEKGIDTPSGQMSWHHPHATVPRVLTGANEKRLLMALRPEFIADFIAAHDLKSAPAGEPCSRYRQVLVNEESNTVLTAVERRAYRGFLPAPVRDGELQAIVRARELWRTRPRRFSKDQEGVDTANKILDQSLQLVGQDLSCMFFFEAERIYWEARNLAARTQKQRQDTLGLGWGNHDHHTFRCSRAHFVDLIQFLTRLGFQKRERYYAGSEAGWGAQIVEQPIAGIVVFADVDLMPEETQIDFSSQKLPAAPKLGTVGLWVGLHGESFLQAGMHHLEARFDFNRLRDQLKERGVNTMNPFSNFQFLRQAFTEGERWPVSAERAERLREAKLISAEQCQKFIREGAIGSHLENLERHGGFKGFNQKSVSVVIAATDPRKSHFHAEKVPA